MVDLLREVFIVGMDREVSVIGHSKGRARLLIFQQSHLAAGADSLGRTGFQALDGCEVQLSGLPGSFKRELEALNGGVPDYGRLGLSQNLIQSGPRLPGDRQSLPQSLQWTPSLTTRSRNWGETRERSTMSTG
jgi:hypothetical protein